MTTEFPGADFAVDYASFLSAYELIAQMPLRDWTAGLPLGNGDLCAVAWQPGGAGGFSWGITKTDVWDLRSPYRDYTWTTHAEVLRLIEQEDWEGLRDLRAREQAIAGDRTQPPNFKPCGVLSLRVPEITDHLYLDTDERSRPRSPAGRMVLRGYESRLSLHRAQLTTDLEKRYMRTRTTSFVHATRNVLLVRFRELPVSGYDSPRARRSEYIYDEPQFRSVTLHRHPDPTLGDPVFGCDGQCFWVDYPFPDGVRYVLAVQIVGADYHTERDDAGWVATLDEPDVPEVTVLASVVTSHESDDPLGAAQELVTASEATGYDGLAREHQRWWTDFWRRSFVSFSDEFLCHLWHHAIYHHAACSRGRYPPPIQTPWYLNDWQQLHGNYHGDINIQQYTWPVFASNHLELGEPYWRLYASGLDELRTRTRQTYGVDGVRFPVLTTPNMIDHAHLWPRYWMGMSAWHAFIFWEFYRYSQDRSWLREVGYPVLKGVAEFYRGYLRRDDAGTYHIYPSHSPEQGDLWIRDPTIDLAFIKVALSAAVEAAELLDVDHDLRATWGEIANHLARYPRNDEVLLDYEGAPPDLPLAHVSLLAPIYPVGDLGLDSPPDDYARARRTFEGAVARSNRGVPFFPFDVPMVGDNTNWMWLAAVAARLGLGDTARAYLYDLGIFPHLKHNGTFFNGYALHPRSSETTAQPTVMRCGLTPAQSTRCCSRATMVASECSRPYHGSGRAPLPICARWAPSSSPANIARVRSRTSWSTARSAARVKSSAPGSRRRFTTSPRAGRSRRQASGSSAGKRRSSTPTAWNLSQGRLDPKKPASSAGGVSVSRAYTGGRHTWPIPKSASEHRCTSASRDSGCPCRQRRPGRSRLVEPADRPEGSEAHGSDDRAAQSAAHHVR